LRNSAACSAARRRLVITVSGPHHHGSVGEAPLDLRQQLPPEAAKCITEVPIFSQLPVSISIVSSIPARLSSSSIAMAGAN
jgi:hypothetical protein